MMRTTHWSAAFAAVVACTIFATSATARETAPRSRTSIHIAQGMWSQHWKLPETLSETFTISESFLCSRYGFITSLKGFPEKREELFANKVLILANVPADAFLRAGTWGAMRDVAGRSDAWVEEFLAQGGGVLVLGGNYALGTGGNKGGASFGDIKGTAHERFLPASIRDNDIDFAKQNRPVDLRPASKHPILKGIVWRKTPVTMFHHDVEPRPDANVLVKAGDAPIMIAGTYKAGRIVLWTATLHGEPPEGKTAYWRWDQWDQLMRNTTDWLAGGR